MVRLFFILALIPLVSFASKGGGGGVGIACYNGEEVTSVELLDLYEADNLGLKLLTDLSGNFEKDIARISKKIYKNESESKNVLDIMTRYKAIRSDSELTLTNDAFPAFLPRGCKLKQVANYYNDTLIWIDQTLYDKMNYINKLALAFHEHIYAQERILGVPDSRYTRTIVGHALSDQDPFDVIAPAGSYTHLCKSADNKVVFSARKLPNTGTEWNYANVWRFDFITLNGHRIFSTKHGNFPISEISPLGDYRKFGVLEHEYPSELKSKINGREKMVVASNSDSLTLSWVGTDPGDRFTDVKVSCTASGKR